MLCLLRSFGINSSTACKIIAAMSTIDKYATSGAKSKVECHGAPNACGSAYDRPGAVAASAPPKMKRNFLLRTGLFLYVATLRTNSPIMTRLRASSAH